MSPTVHVVGVFQQKSETCPVLESGKGHLRINSLLFIYLPFVIFALPGKQGH